jgi:outer membrane protein assembly factor BamB
MLTHNRRITLRSAALVATLALALSPLLARAYDWPLFDFDQQRSGNDQLETLITTGNVRTLQQQFQVSLPGIADGAPVYLSAVSTGSGIKNLIFVTTRNGYIVALDASNGHQIWAKQAASGPNYTTASPTVDPNRQYVYSYGLDGYVHKYQVGDGSEVIGGGWPELATGKPDVEKGSSALSVITTVSGATYLYVANGGYPGDAGDYQGHVTAINLADGSQHVFNAACSDLAIHFIENGTPGVDDCATVQTAVWARPGVVYDATSNRIYFATGNGRYNANAGGHDWSESVLALNPDVTTLDGEPLDSYTPDNYQQLDDTDADLGSTSPALIPMPATSNYRHVAAQSGKEGKIALLNLDNLSGQGGPGHIGGELQKIDVPQGGEVLTTPAVWVNPADGTSWLFVTNDSGIAGLQVTVTGGTPTLTPRWQHGPGGSSPLVANGVLYYAGGSNIYALDPTSGNQLWNRSGIGGIHWESPIVVNGTVYISDYSSHLTAFTLNAAPPCSAGFSDVPNNNIFAAAIYNLACKGVVSGSGAGYYLPAASATRAEFARMAVLGFGYPVVRPEQQDFTDVPPNYFAYNYIASAKTHHLIDGYSDAQCRAANVAPPCFLPNRSISRAELTVLVVRAARYIAITPGTPTYWDVPTTYFAYAAIETAHAKGVVNGYPDGSFRLNTNIRRDELTVILYKAINTP